MLSVDIGPALVRRMSLETFASFAEQTAHESVVADSIGTDDHTRQTVVDFLSRVTVPSLSFVICLRRFCQFPSMFCDG